MSGTNAGIGTVGAAAVTVDPAPCNALTDTPAGLRAPSTALTGASGSGTARGIERSVDIDITAPDASDCPQEWQVGARLTPPYEEQNVTTDVDLSSTAEDVWVPSGLAITVPEAGVYEISASLNTVIAVNASSGPYNLAVVGRLFNVTANAPVPGTQFTAQRNTESLAPTRATSDADRSEFTRFFTVTEPTRVRIELGIRKSVGTPVSPTGLLNANHRLAYKKISD
ncbi:MULTISPECIES: hypothetical protein [Streptomyces]|uniref:Uncharacterized protein n=1 Tax=Streptomyces flavovirens TaxID=52258 RepID=A0ABV8NBZ4_9ACTN|nr:hypothetical protein [Streptomyces sp. MBT51]MBK3592443.1 hypothetical protein [Streptomyces sp. MBT51]